MSTKTFLNSISYVVIPLFLLLFTAGCDEVFWPWSELWNDGGDSGGGSSSSSGDEGYSPGTPAVEATDTYAIALGGVAPGRDELILTGEDGNLIGFSGSSLRFEADTDVVGFLPRPGFDDFASGGGAQIVPQRAGFAVVTYYIDDIAQDGRFLVIVPPQSLIQMTVAEAGTQLTDEAQLDEGLHVMLDSVSPTANALGSVTRNRVDMIYDEDDPSLFNADEDLWPIDPPASYFDAVITAESNGIYQYSPVSPYDPTNGIYLDAEARGFLDPSYHTAYDQAVLSAAYIFSDETEDTTGGAFAFYSPTEDEWEVIGEVYSNGMTAIPAGCGVSDSYFPALAPIQIIIIDGVWTYLDGRPAFVFIRSRDAREYAVVYE